MTHVRALFLLPRGATRTPHPCVCFHASMPCSMCVFCVFFFFVLLHIIVALVLLLLIVVLVLLLIVALVLLLLPVVAHRRTGN